MASLNRLTADILGDSIDDGGLLAEIDRSEDSTTVDDYLNDELQSLRDMDEHERVNALGIWASEFNHFFPERPRLIIDALTDMYDANLHENVELGFGVNINRPVINLIGAITTSGLSYQFSSDSFESGFLTRTILVHGTASHEYFDPFKTKVDPVFDNNLESRFRNVRTQLRGEVTLTREAKDLMRNIEMQQPKLKDFRFVAYSGRRLAHLVKMSMCRCCAGMRMQITEDDVMWANSLLTYTELSMPDALGDFGNTPEEKVKSAARKILESHEVGFVSSGELTEGIMQYTSESNLMLITNALIDMVRSGELARTDVDVAEKSLYSMAKKDHELVSVWNKRLFDSDYISEWVI